MAALNAALARDSAAADLEACRRAWSAGQGEHKGRRRVSIGNTLTAKVSFNFVVPKGARIWSSALSYRNYLWVLGGFSKGEINLNDVWYSTDGSSREKLESGTAFPPRHAHNAFVFKDRIWVMAGLDGSLYNDVWSLQLPGDWRSQGRGRSLEKLISAVLH